MFPLLPHLAWWTGFPAKVGDEEGVPQELLNAVNTMEVAVLLVVTENGSMRQPGWWQWQRQLGLPVEMMPQWWIGGAMRQPGRRVEWRSHLWWRLSAAVAIGCRWRSLGSWRSRGYGGRLGSAATTGIALGAVVPVVQVERCDGGSSSSGA